MPETVTKRQGTRHWRVLAFSLVVALVGGTCVSGNAQSNIQKDEPLANLPNSLSAPKFAVAAREAGERKSATGLLSLPADAQGPVSAALGKDDSGYWVRRRAEGFHGENQRHALDVEFTRQGAEVRSHNLSWLLKTCGYGYGDALNPAKAVAPQAEANRVEYRRDGVNEWYENGPLGLEQGFTLVRSPGKANGKALTVALEVRSVGIDEPNMPETAAAAGVEVRKREGKTLELRGKDGKVALRYTGLTARDATGRELASWTEMRGERLLLRVDDRGARYPVVVDPWIQQGELISSDGGAQDQFGTSVAVNGNTVVVGAQYHSFGTSYDEGAAYVFVNNGGTWSQQAELIPSDGVAYDGFGESVAISGSTVMVGSVCHPGAAGSCGPGAVYVFDGSGGTWSQQAELKASDGVGADHFGWSIAMDSNLAVIGAYNKEVRGHSAQGAAYVFGLSSGNWTQQAELTAADGLYNDEFGYTVALSGSTIVIGAPDRTVGSNQAQGEAYVFTGSGATWSQQAEVTSSDGEAGDFFAWSVAVDGSTAVMGAPCHPRNGFAFCQGGPGAAYVFGESAGTWSQQAELTSSDGVDGDAFGNSVSLSGSTAVMGAPLHAATEVGPGAAYVFGESSGTWSQQAELAASDGVGGSYFGWAVALDGTTIVTGAPAHTVGSNASQGAAYVFVPPSTTVTLSPASLSFGNQAVNTTSAAKTVTLKNTGTATLNNTSIAITAGNSYFAISKNTCGATLPAGNACTVSITFTPPELAAETGTLTFTNNASGSPQTVSLTGTGVAQATLTPSSHKFSKTKVGSTSAAYKFTVKNNLNTTLTGISFSTSAPFAVSTSTCSTTLDSKKSCTISVTFSPTATGTATGTLTLKDSANDSPQTASLSGTGD